MRVSRRALLVLATLPVTAHAASDAEVASAISEAIGGADATEGGIAIRVPALAENGGQVPVTVLVESPQTEAQYVTAIHLIATRNPTPGIASFRLSPALARAEVQTRIRLAEDQQIVAIAHLSDGSVRRAAVSVRITTGGCLS